MRERDLEDGLALVKPAPAEKVTGRDALRRFDTRLDAALSDAVHRLVGEVADRPGFDTSLLTAISAMRGLLLMARAVGLSEGDLEAEWSGVRDRLVLIFREFDPDGV
ncbi:MULTISPECIES: hypothetical protein [unclassified Streptomyces]|uniref:MftR C-terminal domain-containing protein n=1 Tax=Streptomyces sp. NBC_00119 TaxID=2975659 RepID=A0AAU1U0Z7_9ACTN|nr:MULTISPECIES: hypothetical protein [unclassified Streptomyces]MCX4648637.1 hypothetical protein [Streptomyces sp. NBC_01446]MCX5323244.1 hypothetical protein [Streptomyces sp. NBC_00120]